MVAEPSLSVAVRLPALKRAVVVPIVTTSVLP